MTGADGRMSERHTVMASICTNHDPKTLHDAA
jgi:hypothetical protein